jgi:hypothetical protein
MLAPGQSASDYWNEFLAKSAAPSIESGLKGHRDIPKADK